MNVLSLFDGKSCGQIALERAGLSFDKYYASEIDKYAIIVTQANYPNTIQLGDVINWREWGIDWSNIELLIAGSPCQGFSFAGKQLLFDDPRSALYFVFKDIYQHIKSLNPNVKFLLENTRMKKECLDVISKDMNVKPKKINSNLVSAQNRVRYYWANWGFGQPEDRGIRLIDILESSETLPDGYAYKDKSKCVRVGGMGSKLGDKHEWDSPYVLLRPRGNNKGGVRALDGKVPCLTTSSWEHNFHVFDGMNKRRFTPVECERLQTVPDGYTRYVSNTQRYKLLGNGWNIDTIVSILEQGDFSYV